MVLLVFFNRYHFWYCRKFYIPIGPISEQCFSEDPSPVIRVFKRDVQVLKSWKTAFLHSKVHTRITQTIFLIKDLMPSAVNIFSESSKCGMAARKFHHPYHTLPDVNEIGSLIFHSAGWSKHSLRLFKKRIHQQAKIDSPQKALSKKWGKWQLTNVWHIVKMFSRPSRKAWIVYLVPHFRA